MIGKTGKRTRPNTNNKNRSRQNKQRKNVPGQKETGRKSPSKRMGRNGPKDRTTSSEIERNRQRRMGKKPAIKKKKKKPHKKAKKKKTGPKKKGKGGRRVQTPRKDKKGSNQGNSTRARSLMKKTQGRGKRGDGGKGQRVQAATGHKAKWYGEKGEKAQQRAQRREGAT